MAINQDQPILIIGAGISGLLLAQSLGQYGIPVRVFERDNNLETRGAGWGLTLNWSLPALQSLLPEHIFTQIPEAYVDRKAVAEGLSSAFPFFDLSTGGLKASTPKAPESSRTRVTRQGLRNVLASGVNVEWNKALKGVTSTSESVTAIFEDGNSVTGSLLIACDGSHSRVRRSMFPDWSMYDIPVRMLGMKLEFSAEQFQPIRDLDPFFLQGTHSRNDVFVYMSVLDAPGNYESGVHPYVLQICVSWPYREGFFGSSGPTEIPETDRGKYELVRNFAKAWAEPWRSLVLSIPAGTEMKGLKLRDLPPPKDFRTIGRTVLMGDALHAMAMYRGEGANHVILDVQDFVQRVIPVIEQGEGYASLRLALDEYEKAVVDRTRPAVLASRRACMDAHDWKMISNKSPLLTRRMPYIDFEESS
ncbi:FAD-binding protein [Fusarium heterosporum]|uniref:FAD-binding protein n=1 Tax=Fusarium heterosporum TaxID=42747 RepID=A0A8H5TBP0_FUSHE|nr:FAD-binding protein [Fusarium heterosporum]